MKKWIVLLILLLIIFFLSPILKAQEKIELFGYFESQISGVDIKGEFNQLYTNKLRIDLKYRG